MEKLVRYDNGLRLIVENIPSFRSVVTGFWVGTGSSDENDSDNGISHFTEHVMFKGTDKMSAYDIAGSFERLGANINAFTSKECTCYYAKSIDENSEKCFSLLSDIFFDSVFPAEELDKERSVILEEINMVEDSPEDICYDLLAKARYDGHPLGKTILGPAENVKRFSAEDVKKYISQRYSANNIVVSVAGNVTLEKADEFIKKYFVPRLGNNKCDNKPLFAAPIAKRHTQRIKDFEQSNIAVSFPSVGFHNPLSTTQAVLSTLFGGAMSSRLFQRVREQLGLCYSIYSSPSAFVNNGSFNIVVNISAANTERTLDAVVGEINRLLKDGITDEELERSKVQLKSSCIFSQENVQTIMMSNGKLLTLGNEIYDIDKRIKEIDAVTKGGVIEFAQKLFVNDGICSSYVGKPHNFDFDKISV